MRYFSDFERLSKEVRLQALIIIVLLGVVLVEGILLYRASTQRTVIVVPPKVEKEFWVSGSTLSRAYLEQVAIYLADSSSVLTERERLQSSALSLPNALVLKDTLLTEHSVLRTCKRLLL